MQFLKTKILIALSLSAGLFFNVGNVSAASSFSVSTNGADRIVSTTDSVQNCSFPLSLQSSSVNRPESAAASITTNGNTTTFVFNHPTDTNRAEISFRRTINNCEAVFTILELNQPVSQFSLVVTPQVEGVAQDSVVVWEHISLGPLPPEPEVTETPNEEKSENNNLVDGVNYCSDNSLNSYIQNIGILAEEVRIQNNRKLDVQKQQKNIDTDLWQAASNLIEARSSVTELQNNLADWRNRLNYLEEQQQNLTTNLQSAQDSYRALQREYADEQYISVQEGDKPLDTILSGVSISLDGGQTWIVMSGERGIRLFINKIRQDKDKGRLLHKQGQNVKQLQGELYRVNEQINTAQSAIGNTEEAITNSQSLVQSQIDKLKNLKDVKQNIQFDLNDATNKLTDLQTKLKNAQLLLDGCNALNNIQPVSLFDRIHHLIASFFRPLALAYGE